LTSPNSGFLHAVRLLNPPIFESGLSLEHQDRFALITFYENVEAFTGGHPGHAGYRQFNQKEDDQELFIGFHSGTRTQHSRNFYSGTSIA
jgi:hypothetical protein